jgi:ATP:ADP antiporter, AAA family
MRSLRTLWRNFYDVRPGEYGRTVPMFFYLLFVLFAYYILKPVSRAMFLNKFDIDKLPYLYILIAIGGGLLAYFYSWVAVRTSLRVAVAWTMGLSVVCLVIMWRLIRFAWMVYVLNIWVSLFAIVLVSQGWLVASNLFTPREAKRVYALLGMGMVMGAAFGGEFTRRTAVLVGTRNLLLASAVMVILAYAAFRVAAGQPGVSLAAARASESGEAEFSFCELVRDISRTRHLQVIIGIMTVTYLVDVMVEFQFQYMAKTTYTGDQLTAFFGSFYGLWLNLAEFVFQFFLTTAVVSRLGVGGTLQILPVSIMLSSLASVIAPGVWSTGGVRLTEASMRYTMNKTGMELLYMPLPLALRNRVKAFVDIFVDRMSRGLGGMLLVVMISVLGIQSHGGAGGAIRRISILVMLLTVPWVALSLLARREYVATVRKRIAARRLDLENLRIQVRDAETIGVLEQTALGDNPRQAAYALSLLAEAPDYDLQPLLRLFADSPFAEVRCTMYDVARSRGLPDLLDKAQADVQTGAGSMALIRSAAAYLMTVSREARRIARELLESGRYRAAEAALESLPPSAASQGVVSSEWMARFAGDPDPQRRALAALALGAGDHTQSAAGALRRLLLDAQAPVIAAACRAAGRWRDPAFLLAIVPHLSNARVRAAALESLAALGPQICGALRDLLTDPSLPLKVRRQLPRVLKRISQQGSVDVLLAALAAPDLSMRGPVLKALNHLRETARGLHFDGAWVTRQIFQEARYYFELNAALAPLPDRQGRPQTAAGLLARTLEEHLRLTLERLFRLLGLRYPPKEIYSVYLAVSGSRGDEVSAAVEFLDNVLERDLKKILLPLLDAPDNLLSHGRDLFGIEIRDTESALRELIHSPDPWLAACALAAAAELRLTGLAPEIAEIGRHAEPEVSEVARSAELALA